MVPRREAPHPNQVNNLCERCGQQAPLISNENFQGRPNPFEARSWLVEQPENEKSAGRAGPSALEMSLDSSVEGTSHDNASEHLGTTENVIDARLDEMIAIADTTGASLDAVVAQLGRAPENAFRFFVDTLAAIVGGEV